VDDNVISHVNVVSTLDFDPAEQAQPIAGLRKQVIGEYLPEWERERNVV
jgi:hypothetical protein